MLICILNVKLEDDQLSLALRYQGEMGVDSTNV